MSAGNDSVTRLAVSWRVDAAADRSRLDALSRALVAEGLPGGLLPGGPPDELVCVRRVELPPRRMRWDTGDSELVADWGRAVGRAVSEAVAAGGPDVVRYRSAGHARRDLVAGLLRGDRDRLWAWRAVAVWPAAAADAPMPQVLRSVLTTAVREEPYAGVGLVVELARGRLLPVFVAAVPEEVLGLLARAAWRCTTGGPWTRDLRPAGPGSSGDGRRVAARSAVVLAGAAVRTHEVAVALAALAVLEVDTGLATGRDAGRLLAELAGLLDGAPSAAVIRGGDPLLPPAPAGNGLAAGPTVRVPAAAGIPATSGDRSGTSLSGAGQSGPDALDSDPLGVGSVGPAVVGPDALGSAAFAANAGTDVLGPDPVGPNPVGRPAPDRATTTAEAPSSPVPADPAAPDARTQWGGLLFLLPLVAQTVLPEAVAADPARFGPELRPVLHELGRRILRRAASTQRHRDLAPGDPAVLAFAGLAPGAGPPPPPRHPDALDPYVEEVVVRLRDRLATPPGPDPVLAAVCRRTAVIEADPGWIDVMLRLDEVDVVVRRAGLDLNPGYLPWLGCVVRFRYG